MKKSILGALFLLSISLVGCSEPMTTTMEENTEISENTETEENNETDNIEDLSIEDNILTFVNEFNTTNNTPLEYVEDFIPSDKTSFHYRTEFRLGAYKDAIGKSYSFGDALVDIISRKSYSGNIIIRVYMYNATIEQCAEMIKTGSTIMDDSVSDNEIQETINYITEHKEANGYYYANLGLLLLGNDEKGYELMLKMKYD